MLLDSAFGVGGSLVVDEVDKTEAPVLVAIGRVGDGVDDHVRDALCKQSPFSLYLAKLARISEKSYDFAANLPVFLRRA